jgi:hypothetical protein
MIELIKQSAVPANVMRSAARGALTLPAPEMLEILVHLTTNTVFAEQAKMTLAGWDEASAVAVAADPNTPWEVLTYMIAPENLRPKLVPVLLENSSVREAAIMELAQKDLRELLGMLVQSKRVQGSSALLHALLGNPALSEEEIEKVRAALKALGEGTQAIQAFEDTQPTEKTQWEIDHAAEIAAEEAEAKPFSLFGQDDEDLEQLEAVAPVDEAVAAAAPEASAPESPEVVPTVAIPAPTSESAAASEAIAPQSQSQSDVAATPAEAPKPAVPAAAKPQMDSKVRERISTLQKIARLSVGQRIQLAMKGNKEERFILVRDGSKLVAEAVLQSPKVTDSEIETFAGMKNVQEGVLRGIARSHKFMKNYAVVRTLANNPRAPLDLSLTLMNHLMINDLKGLSTNKNVPETLRKLALKKFKEKTEKKAGASG